MSDEQLITLRARVLEWCDAYDKSAEGCCSDDIPYPETETLRQIVNDESITLMQRKAFAFDSISGNSTVNVSIMTPDCGRTWQGANDMHDDFTLYRDTDLLRMVEAARAGKGPTVTIDGSPPPATPHLTPSRGAKPS